jgi:hypothetical protein
LNESDRAEISNRATLAALNTAIAEDSNTPTVRILTTIEAIAIW